MAIQASITRGDVTYTAGEALVANRRVGLKAGSTTTPPEVEYVDAGVVCIGLTTDNQPTSGKEINVRPITDPGTFYGVAAGAFAYAATLYGAADGKVDDTASGSAQWIALEAALADLDTVEMVLYPVLATTAATVSIADAGGFTAQATVEAALQEIYQDILSAQCLIPVPLTQWRIVDTNDIPAAASNGGVPAKDTDPILEFVNGDTDSAIRLNWAATSVVPVTTQIVLGPDFDVSADLVLHLLCNSDAAVDTISMTSDSFFMLGDTKVSDTISAGVNGTALTEHTITIAAADIPAGAQTLSIELTPGAHANDDLYVYATWFEHTRILRTS